jgi:hypothetical protein
MYNVKLKLILAIIGLFIAMTFLLNSCERIDAGHVGVRVNLYGTGKGVGGVTECTGWVFYNPMSTKIYEFPTFMQHKEYTEDNSFVVNSKDGSEFHVSPIINYAVQRDKVPAIFNKYRRTLESIEEGFLKTTIYDAFRMTANAYTAEELISNRQIFENRVRVKLDTDLLKEGFAISQLTSNLGYPETFKKAIEAKKDKKGKEIAAAVPSKIVISFTNFQFSSPKMTVKVKSSQLSKFKSKQKSLIKTYRAKNAKNKG